MRITGPLVAALLIGSTSQAAPVQVLNERTEGTDDATATGRNTATTELAAALPSSQENSYTLFVQGLPQPCTDEQLRGLWWDNVQSKITKITIPVHADGRNKDYGAVEFENEEDMRAALHSHAGVINGNSLSIRASTPDLETEIEEEDDGSWGSGGGTSARGGASRGRGGRGGGRGRIGRGGISIRTLTPDDDDEDTKIQGGGAVRGRGRGGRGGTSRGTGRGRGTITRRGGNSIRTLVTPDGNVEDAEDTETQGSGGGIRGGARGGGRGGTG